MARFRLRWAQLDLARQMENAQFIREFIDLLGETGYNGLFLYLEDRVGVPERLRAAPRPA